MNISIPKDRTPNGKYTKEAQYEIEAQVLDFVNKVCEEAERIETSSTNDVNKVQVTPRTIQKAAKYVIEERVEKIKNPPFIEYICPAIQGIMTLIIGIAPLLNINSKFVVGIAAIIYIISITIQMTMTFKLK